MLELFLFGGVWLFMDQVSKYLARSRASLSRSLDTRLFRLRYVENHRRIYKNSSFRIFLMIVWIFALASVFALRSSGHWFQNSIAMAGIGCAVGSAAGNLLDILRRRFVVDFIDFGWWPVFNLADAGILGGLALAFWRW